LKKNLISVLQKKNCLNYCHRFRLINISEKQIIHMSENKLWLIGSIFSLIAVNWLKIKMSLYPALISTIDLNQEYEGGVEAFGLCYGF
jgi:hypothetical protein